MTFLVFVSAAAAMVLTIQGPQPNPVPNPLVVVGGGVPGGVLVGGLGAVAAPGAAIATDAGGNVYIADPRQSVIVKVAPDGTIRPFAGTGRPGFSGDGGPATSAQLYEPSGLAIDAAGNVYVADSGNIRVRKITPAGIITTVAGNGILGQATNTWPATSAPIGIPNGVAVDATGQVYIYTVDAGGARVHKLTPDGVISTVAAIRTAAPTPAPPLPPPSPSFAPAAVTLSPLPPAAGTQSFGVAVRERPTASSAVRIPGEVAQANLIRQTPPVYPVLARAARISGAVVLEVVLAGDGSVRDAGVVSSASPLLNQAAIDAVTGWLFNPRILGGQAEVRFHLVIDFNLE